MIYNGFYGRCDEDERIIKYVGSAKRGLYLDIGAGDPHTYSNTFHFYELGWHGLAFDPLPGYKELWEKKRPRDKFFPMAVNNYDGHVDMVDTATTGSYIGHEYIKDGKEVYKVECISIPTILDKYPEYKECDFVNLDIETNEDKVLSRCDFANFRPKLIVVEYEVRHIDQRPKWEHYLLKHYALVDTVNNNAFYFRKNLLKW